MLFEERKRGCSSVERQLARLYLPVRDESSGSGVYAHNKSSGQHFRRLLVRCLTWWARPHSARTAHNFIL
jgi:hypothetical protein